MGKSSFDILSSQFQKMEWFDQLDVTSLHFTQGETYVFTIRKNSLLKNGQKKMEANQKQKWSSLRTPSYHIWAHIKRWIMDIHKEATLQKGQDDRAVIIMFILMKNQEANI